MGQSGEAIDDWKGPAFRRTLLAIIRRHVPERDVEDIVQSTLAEALSPTAPRGDDAALRRWLLGVARHKVADRHRRARRESFDLPEMETAHAPHAERDLVRWAERALPTPAHGEDDAQRTLGWLLREGDGEKLESIAESEAIPAPRVRKRVSRLRSHLRAQWKKELALLAALGVIAMALWLAHRARREDMARDRAKPVPSEVTPFAPRLAPPSVPPSAPGISPSAPTAPVPSAAPVPTAAPTARPRSTRSSSSEGPPSTPTPMLLDARPSTPAPSDTSVAPRKPSGARKPSGGGSSI